MKKLPQFELSNEGCVHSVNMVFDNKPDYFIDISPSQMAFELMSTFSRVYFPDFPDDVAYTFVEMPTEVRKSIALEVLKKHIGLASETLIVFSKLINGELIEYTQKGYFEATKQEIEKL